MIQSFLSYQFCRKDREKKIVFMARDSSDQIGSDADDFEDQHGGHGY